MSRGSAVARARQAAVRGGVNGSDSSAKSNTLHRGQRSYSYTAANVLQAKLHGCDTRNWKAKCLLGYGLVAVSVGGHFTETIIEHSICLFGK